jgi:hypothetical protein
MNFFTLALVLIPVFVQALEGTAAHINNTMKRQDNQQVATPTNTQTQISHFVINEFFHFSNEVFICITLKNILTH